MTAAKRTAIIAVACGFLQAGCGGGRPGGGAGEERRTVVDTAGREVRVSRRVDRLIAVGPGALRLVAYLDALDRVVGVEEMEKRMSDDPWRRPYAAALPPDLLALPVIGPGGPGKLPDFERIMQVRPDVVIAVAIDVSQVEKMQAATGVPVVCATYGALGAWDKQVCRSLDLLGEVLDAGPRAARVTGFIRSCLDDLAARTEGIPKGEKPAVYVGGISYKGTHGVESTQPDYLPAKLAGAANVAAGIAARGHVMVDREQILAWDPDCLFLDIGSAANVTRDLARRPDFYRLLGAVKAGRTYALLPYNYYNTNIELALVDAYFIGKTLYPDRFADVAIAERAGAIFETLLGMRPESDPPACGKIRFVPGEGIVRDGAAGGDAGGRE